MRNVPAAALTAALALLLLFAGCGGSNAPAKSPDEVDSKSADGGAPSDAATGKSAASVCTGTDLDLLNVLIQGACEVPNAPSDTKRRDVSTLLNVKVTVDPPKVAPSGHADVIVTFTNKSSDPLPLDFVVDPTPRFPVEVYTATNRRAEMPAGRPPAGRNDNSATTPTTARVTLNAGGKASARIDWSAVKLRWAPELLKGTPPELGYPTAPAGPLPKGKYVLKVITPLTGVFEGMDHEVSTVKVPLVIQ